MGNPPILPRPMKPHVAKVAEVEEKDLRPVGADEPVRPPLPSKHSFVVEKRTEMAALMVDIMTDKDKCQN